MRDRPRSVAATLSRRCIVGGGGGGRAGARALSANMPSRSASEHQTCSVSAATARCLSGRSAYTCAPRRGLLAPTLRPSLTLTLT